MPTPILGVEEIDKKYEVLGILGEGGMGAIYKVRHRLLEEVRVIKMIRSQLQGQQDHEARFLREAKVASRLRHPSIAQIYDFGIGEEGSAYIVMEFIDGRDLSEILKGGGSFTMDQCFEVAGQSLRVLSYLHGKKYVHRDISPDNIMLTNSDDGRLVVKLIDLGIAKSLEGSEFETRTGLFVGKLKYASPEQLGGGDKSVEVGAGSDLYSFGVVLYQLLTGEFPIVGDTEAAIIAGHLFHPPRNFDETDPDGRVPAELRAVVLRALAKRAEERFASAAEFDEELRTVAQAVLGSQPDQETRLDATVALLTTPVVTERPAEAAETTDAARPTRKLDRRWVLSAIAALALVAVSAGLWWSGAWSGGPPRDAAISP